MRKELVEAFRWVDAGPDTIVSDPAGWWRDPALLRGLGDALAEPFACAGVTVVIGPESRGFLLGGLVAGALGAGFVEAYKHAMPGPGVLVSGPLAVRSRLLTRTDRVLVVDDWVETGTQLTAVSTIVKAAGAVLVGASVIVDGREPGAGPAGVQVRALLRAGELFSEGVRPTAELPSEYS